MGSRCGRIAICDESKIEMNSLPASKPCSSKYWSIIRLRRSSTTGGLRTASRTKS